MITADGHCCIAATREILLGIGRVLNVAEVLCKQFSWFLQMRLFECQPHTQDRLWTIDTGANDYSHYFRLFQGSKTINKSWQ